jgi:flagellar protein FliS
MTRYSRAREEYLESEIFVAGPVRRVQLLYEGAIEAIGKARASLARKDIRGRTAQVNKAILILTELMSALDHSSGLPLTKTLAELYDYSQRRLLAGNSAQSDVPFAEVEELLKTVLEGWKGVPEIASSASPSVSGARNGYVPVDNGPGDGFSVRSVDSGVDHFG